MPALYIKDPKVAEMAEELRRLTAASSKTEAVFEALKAAIDAANRESRTQRLESAIAIARRIGPRDEEFDQKAFSDEMWGS